jgi:hypothetical protein
MVRDHQELTTLARVHIGELVARGELVVVSSFLYGLH